MKYSVQLAYRISKWFLSSETVNQSKLSVGVDGQLKIFNWNFIAVSRAGVRIGPYPYRYGIGRLFAS